ncbi:MAG: ABC transporter permease [Lachnospiraceae bacterium]|nr:ABC transporter permease [Lachnospiraceae bacterium]
MRTLFAFVKKEWMEQIRSGRLIILAILFVLLGIMNPAIAKLTPWMLEVLADSLAENGMVVTSVNVDAMTSWVQFFKNIPMGLIAFILLESSIFTKEYQSGTLVLALTKGLERYKVVLSKTLMLTVLWSACYWLCFVITYGYNAYFWDNGIAQNLIFAVNCWWLLGLWAIALTVFFSAAAKSNTGVLAGTGGVFLAVYLIGLFPKVKEYAPPMLMNAVSLLSGNGGAVLFKKAVVVTIVMCILFVAAGIPILNKKKL